MSLHFNTIFDNIGDYIVEIVMIFWVSGMLLFTSIILASINTRDIA